MDRSAIVPRAYSLPGIVALALSPLACAQVKAEAVQPSDPPSETTPAREAPARAPAQAAPSTWPALVSAEPAEDAPSQLQQFGRLVGVWSCTSEARQPDGSFKPGPGQATWTWFYTLGGRAVADVFEPGPGPVGTNVRVYDPETDTWEIQWVTGALTKFERITAKATADAIVMHGEAPASPPFPVHRRRVTFSQITQGSFEWKYEATKPGADTGWAEYSRLHCKRRGDVPG